MQFIDAYTDSDTSLFHNPQFIIIAQFSVSVSVPIPVPDPEKCVQSENDFEAVTALWCISLIALDVPLPLMFYY
jgi:hypothetical protein